MHRRRTLALAGLLATALTAFAPAVTSPNAGAALAPAAAAAQDPSSAGVGVVVDGSQLDATERGELEGRFAADLEPVYGTDLVAVAAEDSTGALLEALAAAGAPVESVDPPMHADTTPTDPYWSAQWGLRQAQLPTAWDITSGMGQTIAILDTGVNVTSELTGRVLPGFDFVDGDDRPADPNGHGTTVATVAAADHNNGIGGAGACPRCRILPVRVLDLGGNGTASDLIAGINWAVDHGADIINVSLSGPAGASALAAAIDAAVARGVPVIAAAGNDGTTVETYPAAYPSAIAVAAIDPNGALYSFSTRGSWVDVSAAGTNVALNAQGAVVAFTGTSSATPVVAGALALARAVDPAVGPSGLRARLATGAAIPDGGYRLDATRLVLDSVAPVVGVTTRKSGQTVTISITAIDRGSGLGAVNVLASGVATPLRTVVPSPRARVQKTARYTLRWNTSGVAPGVHTLTVQVADRAGNLRTVTRSVTV